MVDTDTGEMIERSLLHADGEAQQFYESLSGEVLVGDREQWEHAVVRAAAGKAET